MTRRIAMLMGEEYATALANFLTDSASSSGGASPSTVPPTPALGGTLDSTSSFFTERDLGGRTRGGALGSMFDLLGHKTTTSGAISSAAGGASTSVLGTPQSVLSSPGTSTPASPQTHSPSSSTILQRPNLPLRTPSVVSPHVQALLEDEFSRKSFSLKPVFIEAIQELMDEVELTYRSVGEQSIDHIHSG